MRRAYYNGVITMFSNVTRRSAVPAAAAVLALALSLGAGAADIAPVTRVEPEFPREAISAGADKGRVKARMTVDASGEVTRVEILDAAPRRLFERAVIKTLSQWKFAPGSDGRLMDIEIDFHL
jgi:periplasmic protein TonB